MRARMWSSRDPLFFIAGGNTNRIVPEEDSLAVSRCTLIIWFRILSLGILPKGAENLQSHKTCTQMCIATLFIIAKMPFSKWMDKLWYIQTTDSYLTLERNEQAIKRYGENFNGY